MKYVAPVLALLALQLLSSCGDDGPSGPHVRLALAPQDSATVGDLDAALMAVEEIIRARADALDGSVKELEREGDQIIVEISGLTLEQAEGALGQRGLLEFCQPVMNEAGDVAVVREGEVQLQPGTCEPERDAAGLPLVEGGMLSFEPWARDSTVEAENNPLNQFIVWEPATARVAGQQIGLSSIVLMRNTFVTTGGILNLPQLVFEWDDIGADVSEAVTSRLSERNYPLAPFLDGEPVRDSNGLVIAPHVQSAIRDQGVINGLNPETAKQVSALLNAGTFPLALHVVEAVELGE